MDGIKSRGKDGRIKELCKPDYILTLIKKFNKEWHRFPKATDLSEVSGFTPKTILRKFTELHTQGKIDINPLNGKYTINESKNNNRS